MFNPFFKTKPAGGEPGLGFPSATTSLSNSRAAQSRSIRGRASSPEIRIILPRAAVFVAESGGRGVVLLSWECKDGRSGGLGATAAGAENV
jgi:hypothetical protein